MAAELGSDSPMDDDSESDFEGFRLEDLGSDLDVSSVSSVSSADLSDFDDEDVENTNSADPEPSQCFSDKFTPFTTMPFRGNPGPVLPPDFNVEEAVPLDYFSLLVHDEMITNFVKHTNSYATWGRDRPDPKWHEVTEAEMRAFLALNIFMEIDSKPANDMYWSKDVFVDNSGFKGTMQVNRYEKISQYFHISDRAQEAERGTPTYDLLYKIRPLMEHFLANCQHNYKLSKEIAIDEAMIAFTGRLSYKQYLPAKPIKRGIKIWMLCDSVTAYLHNFEVYLGKSGIRLEHGLGHAVVTNITRGLEDQNHWAFFDNYFNSVTLVEDLLATGIYACGTARADRKQFPEKLKKLKKMQRGGNKTMQKGQVTATVWQDKKQVNMLSTLSDPKAIRSCNRRQGVEVVQVPQPHSVFVYNKFMNGVDKHDQMRMTYAVGRDSKKAWKYLCFFLNWAIVNAFIVYKLVTKRSTKKKRYTHLDFRLEVAHALHGAYCSRKRSAVSDLPRVEISENLSSVHVSTHMNKSRRCKWHSMKQVRRDTMYGCRVCGVHLCKEGYHAEYHHLPLPTRPAEEE